jgi:hypothetical protein
VARPRASREPASAIPGHDRYDDLGFALVDDRTLFDHRPRDRGTSPRRDLRRARNGQRSRVHRRPPASCACNPTRARAIVRPAVRDGGEIVERHSVARRARRTSEIVSAGLAAAASLAARFDSQA